MQNAHKLLKTLITLNNPNIYQFSSANALAKELQLERMKNFCQKNGINAQKDTINNLVNNLLSDTRQNAALHGHGQQEDGFDQMTKELEGRMKQNIANTKDEIKR